MTIDEFKSALVMLLDDLDNSKNLTITIAILNDIDGSIDIMGTGCLVCSSDEISNYIEIKEIPHVDNQKDEKIH